MGKKKNKVYAIARGVDSKTGKEVLNIIVDSWAKCEPLIKGVKGAKYKSYDRMEDAKEYLENTSKNGIKMTADTELPKCLHAYVDGSYNDKTEGIGTGIVLVNSDVIQNVFSLKAGDNLESAKNLRQTVGELVGALAVVNSCKKSGITEVAIFHDYEGVAGHALGTWDRNSEFAEKYYWVMQDRMKEGMTIHFIQVNSHIGVIMNEVADDLAKKPIDIASTGVVHKHLASHEFRVKDLFIKEKLMDLGYPEGSLII